METKPIRIAVIEDPASSASVRRAISGHTGIELVGTGVNGREAIQLASRLRPDVMTLDFELPLLKGLEAAARIHRVFPDIALLLFSSVDDPEAVKRALRLGVFDVLPKTSPDPRICEAILATRQESAALPPQRYASMWTFAGAKAGSGCTTLAVNTAYDLASLGYKTVLVDFANATASLTRRLTFAPAA